MFSTRPLISKSSSPFISHLMTVPSVPITISIIVTFMFHSPSTFHFLSILLWSAGTAKSIIQQARLFLFFFSLGVVVWRRLGDPFISQNPWEVCESHSPGRILGCIYTTCSHGQISISGTIPSGLPSPPSRVSSYTLFSLIYRIPLYFYHHITYICSFLVSCQFFL